MIENLKHAVWSKQTVTVAGGLFWPDEVKVFVEECERNARVAELAKKYAEASWGVKPEILAAIREALES